MEWPGCYWHNKLQLMCVVYVDDFLLSGPSGNLAAGWKLIREHIVMDDPEKPGLFLGCDKHFHDIPCPGAANDTIRVVEYDMENQLKQCLALYTELTEGEMASRVDR